MFKYILVPLDESSNAEQALPIAARIAHINQAEVSLVHILLPLTDYGIATSAAAMAMNESYTIELQDAENYMHTIAHAAILKGLKVTTHILNGPLNQALLDFAKLQQDSLIVLSSQADTGLWRFLKGGLGQNLIRHSASPVLVLRNDYSVEILKQVDQHHPFSMLAALDGSSSSESALLPAAQLSAALSAPNPGKLHLLHIVRPSKLKQRQQGQNESAATEQAVREAQAYLGRVKEDIQHKLALSIPLDITSSVIVDDNIAAAIVKTAEEKQVNMEAEQAAYHAIAVVTHKDHGLSYWFGQHVSEHLLGVTHLPLLVVRLHTS
ncbi:universal stress protein [Dictyobacter arantiisoli]|uniref:UspA domain-containing protein n=1 Tax=Dictyobacter arantiisoli TaxID=2014874 RepID=A0A5A5TE08_9CHLR|nr:universal stress protein [Dictyobacter arantiisoli]GCF09652.1 hypothetical protein KDI_32160 [Dictyobacter arantiisoli]